MIGPQQDQAGLVFLVSFLKKIGNHCFNGQRGMGGKEWGMGAGLVKK